MGLKAVPMRYLGLILSVMVCGCLLFLLLPPPVLADGGMISIADKLLYEPGQKAIIAWDGQQEILILSTDVYAEADTTALRIIPLPSQPEKIEQGDFNSFHYIGKLIYDRFDRRTWLDCAGGKKDGGGVGVDIVFHEKIGAHDIWVAKATDAAELIKWGEDFLVRNQIQHQISSPGLESLAAQYIQEGIQFFVFDLVELSPDQNSVEPIVYQFQSDTLYFPLRISSIIPGETQISLFLLTPEPLVDVSQLPENKSDQGGMEMKIAQTKDKRVQFKLGEKELASIDPRLTELLPGHAWLTAVQSYDPRDYRLGIPLASLDKDVKLTRASFGELPGGGGGTPGWVWWLVGLAVVAIGGLLYVIRMWPRWQRGNW